MNGNLESVLIVSQVQLPVADAKPGSRRDSIQTANEPDDFGKVMSVVSEANDKTARANLDSEKQQQVVPSEDAKSVLIMWNAMQIPPAGFWPSLIDAGDIQNMPGLDLAVHADFANRQPLMPAGLIPAMETNQAEVFAVQGISTSNGLPTVVVKAEPLPTLQPEAAPVLQPDRQPIIQALPADQSHQIPGPPEKKADIPIPGQFMLRTHETPARVQGSSEPAHQMKAWMPSAEAGKQSGPIVIEAMTATATKPLQHSETIQLEVAPGIEKMRVQPPQTSASTQTEQEFTNDAGSPFAFEDAGQITANSELEQTDADFTSVLSEPQRTPLRFEPVVEASTLPNQQAPDPHSVAKQVLDGIKLPLDGHKTSEMVITLKPEHLGEVTVKISVDGNRVAAVFHSANPEVRGILEGSMTQLRQEMSQQGWNFEHGGIFGDLQGFLQQQQRQPASYLQPEQPNNNQSHLSAELPDETAGVNYAAPRSHSAVDYRV